MNSLRIELEDTNNKTAIVDNKLRVRNNLSIFLDVIVLLDFFFFLNIYNINNNNNKDGPIKAEGLIIKGLNPRIRKKEN